MRRGLIYLAFFMAFWWSALAPAASEQKPLVLTPHDTIILDDSLYAGQFLQYYLVKFYIGEEEAARYAPGEKLDRAAAELFPLLVEAKTQKLPTDKKVIAVGKTRFLTAEDRQRLEESPGAMLIERRGNVVVIAGSPLDSGWSGTFKAVGKFLDLCCGVRFYAPDDLWISRPKTRYPEVGDIRLFQKEYFATVTFSHHKRLQEWLRMNPLPNRIELRATHALASIFPPEKYATTHPEIYEMRAGKRTIPSGKSWNPCLSAKALPDLAMEYIRERFKNRPQWARPPTYISFGVMDCPFECTCLDCLKSVKEHNGSYSNLYYTFLNEVARRCRKEFPGLLLTAYVYSNVRTPPVGMKIEPNIVVDCVIKSYRFVDPSWLEYEKQRIKAFAELGAMWTIHDWCFSGVSPREYTRQYAAFLQWAAQNGMIGAVVETSPEENWYLDGAKYWILSQLFWNPYLDVDLLWKQYCDDMYGAASEVMFRFFRHFADKYTYAPGRIHLHDFPREEPALYSAEDLAYQRALLEKAISLTKEEPEIQARLEKVMRYFVAHELFAQAVAEPYRLAASFDGKGVNTAALNYYVTEKENKLARAIAYYKNHRTLPPDTNEVGESAGLLASYIANYTRGKKQILSTIRHLATANVDLQSVDEAKVRDIVSWSIQILHLNLPKEYDKKRVAEFEDALRKMLWIPRLSPMPLIDGQLDEPTWERAASMVGFTERDTLEETRHKVSGKVMRVGDHLVFGLVCHQSGPIWVETPPAAEAGALSWRESGAEFFFGKIPKGEERPEFAQYIVNYLGAFEGYGLARHNREGVEVKVRFNPAQGLAVIEAAFPLKTLNYDFTKERALSFNIMVKATSKPGFPDNVLGWYPIFYTPHDYDSRAIVFME